MIKISLLNDITNTFMHNVLGKLQQINSNEEKVILDLSKIESIDTEGLCYIALLPLLFEKITNKIEIIPPCNIGTFNYLDATGLLRILLDRYKGLNFTNEDQKNMQEFLNSAPDTLETEASTKVGIINQKKSISDIYKALELFEEFLLKVEINNSMGSIFYELSKNVFHHSQEPQGSFSFRVFRSSRAQAVELCVADFGVGIKKSLIKNEKINPNLEDSDYIKLAVKPGISSTNKDGRGLGLHVVNSEASRLTIASGKGKIIFSRGNELRSFKYDIPYLGTSIKSIIYERQI